MNTVIKQFCIRSHKCERRLILKLLKFLETKTWLCGYIAIELSSAAIVSHHKKAIKDKVMPFIATLLLALFYF